MMNVLQSIQTMRPVRLAPALSRKFGRRIADKQREVMIARLRHFRTRLQRDFSPEPWTGLQAPVVLILADVCEALGLTQRERSHVFGCEGALALTDELEARIRPIAPPRLTITERQSKALAYAREHGALDARTYRQLCPHWSPETLRLDLANLVARGLLVKNGSKKATRYTLPEVRDVIAG